MFSYNKDVLDIIISCTFDGINIANLDPNEFFHELVGNQHLSQGHALNVHVSPGQYVKIVQCTNMLMAHYPKINLQLSIYW